MPDDPLVGRAAELTELGRLATTAASGVGRVAVLTGIAGIGKTRLASHLLSQCADSGFAVFSGTAHEMEQGRPFGVVAEALRVRSASDDHRAEIGRLLRGDGSGQPAGNEFRVTELVLDFLEEITASQPVAVLLDDLHWADRSSLLATHRLARECAEMPLLLICSLRPYPQGSQVRALTRSLADLGVRPVEVGPLAAGPTAELAARLAGAPPGPTLVRRLAATGGNPLFVRELMAALTADGTLRVTADGLAEVTGSALPPSLRQTILLRFSALPEDTLGLLRTAAALGSRFTVLDLAAVTERQVGDLAAALNPALIAGALVADEQELVFRHCLVREALYQDTPPPVRKPLHRELARRLAKAGATAGQVAEHLALGADVGDAEAIGWLTRAADEAAPKSPAIAIDLLERALGLCEPDGRGGVEAQLVTQLLAAGRAGEAEAICRRVIGQAAGPGAAPRFRSWLAMAMFTQGRMVEARAALAEAGRLPALPAADRALLSAYAAYAGAFLRDPDALASALAVLAARPPEPAATVARVAAALAEMLGGRADRALERLAAAPSPGSPDLAREQLLRGMGLLELDRHSEARQALRAGLRANLDRGALGGAVLHHVNLACVEFSLGRYDDALAEHAAAVDLAEQTGQLWLVGSLGLAALIAVHRADPAQARHLISTAESVLTAAGPQLGDAAAAWAQALLAEGDGDTGGAVAAARRSWERRIRGGLRRHLASHGPDTVRIALRAGDRDLAERVTGALQEAASELPVSGWRGGALRCRGLLADDPELLVAAAEAFRGGEPPLDLALSLEDAAEALARAGHEPEARPLAAEALATYAELDATADIIRAKARLRSAGLRTGVRGPRRRPKFGWDSLTEGELRVVRLLAEGRSNPEIAAAVYLTRRTVRAHVSSALRKLDLSSRVELAVEATRHGV